MSCTILDISKTVLPRLLYSMRVCSCCQQRHEVIFVGLPPLKERKICLVNHKVIFPEIQGTFIAEQRVIAGHFRWGESSSNRDHRLLTSCYGMMYSLELSGEGALFDVM